jgi:hypothetical protein
MKKVWEVMYMKSNSLNIEKYFMEDAADIEIDNKFKNDLKMRIMAQEKETVTERPVRLKVAGWIAFAAFTGGTLFGAGGLYASMVARNSKTPSVLEATTENPNQAAYIGEKNENTKKDDNASNNAIIKQSVTGKSSQNSAAAAADKSSQKINTPAKTDSGSKNVASTEAQSGSGKSGTNVKPEENVNTINLKMVSGRYLIQSITAVKNESVEALPAELNSLSPDECAKLPTDTNNGLVSESNGSIYMINHVNGKQVLVDNGTAPALYSKINIISYVKNETEGKSNVWIFDGNSASKYNVLSDDSGKNTYLRTFWSSDGTGLYVLSQNNETKNCQLVKLTLDIK